MERKAKNNIKVDSIKLLNGLHQEAERQRQKKIRVKMIVFLAGEIGIFLCVLYGFIIDKKLSFDVYSFSAGITFSVITYYWCRYIYKSKNKYEREN